MDVYCTRPGCDRPENRFPDLDDSNTLLTVQQKFCTHCGMPQILIGRYIPTRLLGQGGFGAAYLACDRYTPTRRACVVKQFLPSGNLTAEQRQLAQSLFTREAQVLEEIGSKHPQIPDLYAFFPLTVDDPRSGKSAEYFYLVQEFIAGQNLEEMLAASGPFAGDRVRDICIDMLQVLQFVHGCDVIHRDIKLSNIMERPDGRRYLLDFGAVKQITNAPTGAQTGSTGIYSLGFAPPEQMAGHQIYPSTDLYALAVTCICLLTGQQPGDLYDAYRNTWQWRSHLPPSTQLDPHFADVLDCLLQAAPQDRFASAAEVLELLTPPTIPPAPKTPIAPTPSPRPRASAPPAGTQMQPSPSAQPVAQPKAGQPRAMPPGAGQPVPARPPRSVLELLANGAFTGFEAAVLGVQAIALVRMTGSLAGGIALWGALMVLLVLLQWRRVIERVDLAILAALSAGLVVVVPVLRAELTVVAVLTLAIAAALVGVAAAALFRLFYRLLSALL
jgi:serine/threonine-protein kinase